MKVGLLVFPGSNCDQDLAQVLQEQYNAQVDFLWHTQEFALEHDLYFVPGGFSYGDYLRSGAMAARSQSMRSLQKAADKGALIVGICNGFQILTEAHLLPGALIRNVSLKHVCTWASLEGAGEWQKIIPPAYALPVSHSEGNYRCSEQVLQELKTNRQIILRYKENFNGSVDSIAGIRNRQGNVLGLMPHPERAVLPSLDNENANKVWGKIFFDKIFSLL